MRFEGIYPPVITPYGSDHSIDENAFREVLDFLIEAGVHGLIVAGTTGEYYAQTIDERMRLMRLAKEHIAGRLPLIIGTGAIRTEDSVALARAAKEIGADGLLVATPPYACPTGREIALHALAIDEAAGLPIMLYNYPGRMSVQMDRETLDLFAGNSRFCAIKESSGDPNRLHMLACDYPSIQISCGMDDQALEFFAWGARSWVCAASNFAPDEHIALYRACAIEENFVEGRRIMTAMMPLMRLLEQGGKFVQCIKHGVTLRGIEAGPPRLPMQPLTDEEKIELERVIAGMKAAMDDTGMRS